MAKLFGFSIDRNQDKSPSIVSPVPQTNEDGVDNYVSSGFYGQYVDIEGVFKTEHDLIKRYREMSLHPEADGAIEDVVNEAIVSDLYDSPVEIGKFNLYRRVVEVTNDCFINNIFNRPIRFWMERHFSISFY